MNNIRFGLVGCGKIAERHASILSNGCIEGAELAAVCDYNANRSYAFAEKYSVSTYDSLANMMGTQGIDAIVILTPSGLHAQHVIEASEYGLPIVVEKPMALTLDDADRMIKACDKSGSKLFVVMQNRFNAPVIELRKAVNQGRFGKLVMGTVRVRWCRKQEYYDSEKWRGTWKYDGGVLANQAFHHIDLLRWMMGPVESVFGVSSTALADIEAEDTAVVTLKFENGALGVIEATTATRPSDLEGSLSILGEKGSVVIGGFSADKMDTWEFNEAGCETEFDYLSKRRGYAHAKYYEHVVYCILNKRPALEGLMGRRSLELVSAIYNSIETGREITMGYRPSCKLGRP